MLHLAETLAVQAGEVTRDPPRSAATRKPDDTVVTQTDHAIQEQAVAAIVAQFPDHAIVAEESDHAVGCLDRTAARFVWVIDPLDGTRNYAAGMPCYATSIAVLDRGEPIVGVVYEHNLRRLYSARLGGGAYCDAQAIRAVDSAVYHDHLVGVPSSKDDFAVAILRAWAQTKGLVFRSLGSAAMHLALVACGAMSATLSVQTKIWDIAAGALLVREAGGRITTPAGDALTPFDLSADPNRNISFLAATAQSYDYFLRATRSALSNG